MLIDYIYHEKELATIGRSSLQGNSLRTIYIYMEFSVRRGLRMQTSGRRKLWLLVLAHTDQSFENTHTCTQYQCSHLDQR